MTSKSAMIVGATQKTISIFSGIIYSLLAIIILVAIVVGYFNREYDVTSGSSFGVEIGWTKEQVFQYIQNSGEAPLGKAQIYCYNISESIESNHSNLPPLQEQSTNSSQDLVFSHEFQSSNYWSWHRNKSIVLSQKFYFQDDRLIKIRTWTRLIETP